MRPSLPQNAMMPGRVSRMIVRNDLITCSGVPATICKSPSCCSNVLRGRDGDALWPATNSTNVWRDEGEKYPDGEAQTGFSRPVNSPSIHRN